MATRGTLAARALLVTGWLVSSAAAENPERPGQRASTDTRIVGATGIRAFGRGFLSVGGSELRYLAPGARRWKGLLRVPGDNLYRIAVDPEGERVLASWEKDPFVHCLTPRTGEHVRVSRPAGPAAHLGLTGLHSLAFSSDGASALIFMSSPTGSRGARFVAYRAPLDGSGPEELFQVDGGLLIATGRFGAVLAMPPSPKERCTAAECFPSTSRIVAFEVSASGVRENVLLTSERVQVRKARQVRSQDPELFAFELELTRGGRAVLLYEPRAASATYRELPPQSFVSQPTRWAVVGGEPRELVYLKEIGTDLVVHREALDGPGRARIVRLPSRHNYSSPVYGFGLRADGTAWIHWGDHLALADGDGIRGVSLKPLAGRMSEWAGADLYLADPETLWIGVEMGPGRDFVRVGLDDAGRQARPWPGKPSGCRDLPPVASLMRWPAQSWSSCSGGMPNDRVPKRRPPVAVKELPDGTKIVDAGERGCMRIREKPCTSK